MLVSSHFFRAPIVLVVLSVPLWGCGENAGNGMEGDAGSPYDGVVEGALISTDPDNDIVLGADGKLYVDADDEVTTTGMTSFEPEVGDTYVVTSGFTRPGDGGGAIFVAVDLQPAHAFKAQDATGQWYEGVPYQGGINVKQFGAVGDGVTDDQAAIQSAFNYVMSGLNGGAVNFPFADGEVYGIGSTLTLDRAISGTGTNLVWLRGTGSPDRQTGGSIEKNMIKWIGAAGPGPMLQLNDPLDHRISQLGFNGSSLVEDCMIQNQTRGGWGSMVVEQVVVQDCTGNLWEYQGGVDGGRNVWSETVLRKSIPFLGNEVDEALLHYNGANNVNDTYNNIEFLHVVAGAAQGVAVMVSDGSPDITISGGFTKAGTTFVQGGTGGGVSSVGIFNLYVEGPNFYRADKASSRSQQFANIRHPATGGAFVQALGNTNGQPMIIDGGYTGGDINITNRDDFPLVMTAFDVRPSSAINLDSTVGPRTNLIQIGRSAAISPATMTVAANAFVTRVPDPVTGPILTPNFSSRSIAYGQRPGGASLSISNPSVASYDIVEDEGMWLTVVAESTGANPVTLTWGSGYRFAGGTAPATVAGRSRSILRFLLMDGVWYEVSRSLDVPN